VTYRQAEKQHVDGTHRTVEPGDTLDRLVPLLSGIGVTRVAVITGLDRVGIPVVTVCRPNSRSLSVSQGKGVDVAAAKVSGIMEAIEGWHAENVLLPLRLATYRELRAVARVVEVEQLPRALSSRFDPDQTILWIEGTDIINAEELWVPFECVHLDCRVPRPEGSGCFLGTSTGLAAGNHLLEAVSHGLCEVIERDAIALWAERDGSDRATRRLDLGTVEDPGCRWLLDQFEAAGVGVTAADLTTDVGLPVLSTTVVDRSPDLVRRLPAAIGFGCHPDSTIALSRALTEAAQARLTLISGTRDDLAPDLYRRVRDTEAVAFHVSRLDEQPAKAFPDVAHDPAATIDEDVVHELDQLRAVGISRAILIDLTRPECRVPVVRMIVPGLEGWVDRPGGVLPGARRLDLRAAR
jgi:ribosomal protein S12 methylthiotransferase accessory factor